MPDIRGNWIENPSTGSARGCQNPAGNGLFSDAIGFEFTIPNQTGRNFNFTRLRFDARPLSLTETCSGTVSSDGLVSSSCTYEETSNGAFKRSGTYTLTGSLVGNTLTYHITGQDLVGDTCQWDQRGTDTRSGSIPPPIILPIHIPFDLNGDGKADLVWRNMNNGVVAGWLMNGTTMASVGFPAGVPGEWQIEGIGDVNGDGKADVIWQHSVTGTVAVWLMNGLSITSVGFSGSTTPDWQIEGVGDVDGDGKADIIWRNQLSILNPNPGQVFVWLMDGANIRVSTFLAGLP